METQTTTRKNGPEWKKKQDSLPKVDLSTLVYGKVPPQARELEEAILGAIMLEKGAFDLAAEIIKAESFYVDAHQRIFKAIVMLNGRSENIDILTVSAELQKMGCLEEAGGMYGVMKLTKDVVSSAHIEDHCKIVQERYIKREMIAMGGQMITMGYEDATDAFELLDFSEKALFDLSAGNLKNDFHSTADLASSTLTQIEFLMNNRQELTGVTSGFRSIDAITGGWQPTDLIILAARPSVGKTAFALNLARNAAMHSAKPVPVGIISLEMSKGQLMRRFASAESKIGLDAINRGRLDDLGFGKVHDAVCRISEAKIYIDDSGTMNIFEARAKARRMVSIYGVGLLIIDYLQLMSGSEGRGNREQEISKISRGLKGLAKELNIPIIALSQMSRDIEKRAGGVPQLSDLRESGAIEQDADLVAFLYRMDYQQDPNTVDPAIRNDAFIKFAKHRNGGLETLAFHTDLSIQQWFDPEGWREHKGNNLPAGNWFPQKNDRNNSRSEAALYIDDNLF
jgi:replicative DNA helicase